MCQKLRCFFITIITISIFLGIAILCLPRLKNSKLQNKSTRVESGGDSKVGAEKKHLRIKKKIHVPKFMLDLYEDGEMNGYGGSISRADVVRSVIPRSAGIKTLFSTKMTVTQLYCSRRDLQQKTFREGSK